MLARQGMSVVSSPDRVAGARLAVAQGADVVVLDDAFQHRRVGRDLDIVVVDGRWPLAGGPIPVGTRREPLDSLRRADVLWVNHGPVPAQLLGHLDSQAVVVCADLAPRAWLKGGATLPLESLRDRAVYAFAGIARPGRFLEQLVALGLRLRGWRTFADHHPYSAEDLASIRAWAGDGLLVTTEKDLARLPEDMQVYALSVECRPTEGVEAFEALYEERVA
jgi:tetraacyldisaccharide 4'-kinase